MTNEELRALAEKARDARSAMDRADAMDRARGSTGGADYDAALAEHDAAESSLRDALSPARILALLDANAAMVAALRQAAWHMGTDPDRNALVQAGHGWKTTSAEAADMIRAVLALAEKLP